MKVVIAIDESEYASAIQKFVVSHQWKPGTEFAVLSVVEPLKIGNIAAVLPGPVLDEIVEAKSTFATKLLKQFSADLHKAQKDCHVRTALLEGNPKEEIITYARSFHADLIIVGSHGKQALKKLLLGSVSLTVVSHAPCSVVVVHLPQNEDLHCPADLALVSEKSS